MAVTTRAITDVVPALLLKDHEESEQNYGVLIVHVEKCV